MVVGFDRTHVSEAALLAAHRLGHPLAATIHVVHAVSLDDFPVDPDGPGWEEAARLALRGEADAVAAVLHDYPWGWTHRAWRGDPAAAIIEAAAEVGAELVVVGTRGEGWRHLLEHLVSPSVSHRLIGAAGRPVLVVPDDGGGRQ